MNETIVVKLPGYCKDLIEPFKRFCATRQSVRRAAKGGAAVDYAAIEREVASKAAAMECAMHDGLLSELEVDSPKVEIGGKTYSRVGRSLGTYFTMAGPVEVKRTLYREDGCRNAKTVDAISLRTGAVGRGWMPDAARAMAYLLQQGTSREAKQTARRLGRLPFCRASFERVGHEVGGLFREHQADIEDELIQEMDIPSEATSISVALDRVSLPMEEPASRPVGRPRKDAPEKPIERNFRMAYCAALTFHDKDGDGLYTIRYGCMPTGQPELLAQGMAVDVHRLLERRSSLRVSMLADGSPEMWNLMGAVREIGTTPHEFVDFYHLMEKLHPAAAVIHNDDDAAAKEAARRWRQSLRQRSSAAAEILKELEDSGCEHQRRGDQHPVHEAITYIRNNGHRMNYASALRRGFSIGSGTVEATCKTLVGLRMKRCGSRWKEETGDHVLQLRALGLSDRFEPAMDKLFETRRTSVRKAA